MEKSIIEWRGGVRERFDIEGWVGVRAFMFRFEDSIFEMCNYFFKKWFSSNNKKSVLLLY